jgi:hypothetical protein
MSNSDENHPIIAPKPLEIKLADVMFFALRKHLMVFKDLTSSRYVHYTFVITGSMIDAHKTLEDQDRHIPLLEIQFNWKFLMERVIQEINANMKSLFHLIKITDTKWKELDIEYIPTQMLMQLLSPLMKGGRWNCDIEFLEELEQSLTYAKIKDLTGKGLIMGTASHGRDKYLVISNGTDCLLLNYNKISKIIDKNFNLAIRKIQLKHYTIRSIFWYIKIKLLNLFYPRHLKDSVK